MITSVPIRIKFHVKSRKQGNTPRDTFWDSIKYIRPEDKLQDKSIDVLESTLVREFGLQLKSMMQKTFDQELHNYEDGLFGRNHSDYFKIIDHYYFEMRHREKYPYSEPFFGEFLSRIIQFRATAASDNTDFRELLHKQYLLTQITFSTSIVAYSSLELALIIGGLPRLIEFYEGNYEYFQAFLSSYLPLVFAETVGTSDSEYLANYLEAQFSIPDELKESFHKKPAEPREPVPHTITPEVTIPTTTPKAHFLWKIANYSLLIPVLLALLILYVTFIEMSEIRKKQIDSQEILFKQQQELIEYQMKILKETKDTKGTSVK